MRRREIDEALDHRPPGNDVRTRPTWAILFLSRAPPGEALSKTVASCDTRAPKGAAPAPACPRPTPGPRPRPRTPSAAAKKLGLRTKTPGKHPHRRATATERCDVDPLGFHCVVGTPLLVFGQHTQNETRHGSSTSPLLHHHPATGRRRHARSKHHHKSSTGVRPLTVLNLPSRAPTRLLPASPHSGLQCESARG
jgi:hypothetical protein